MKDIKSTQVFTPPWVTNEMLDMLEKGQEALFSDENTFLFEPSCGAGDMLIVCLDRIFTRQKEKLGDSEQAMALTLFKFYAVELDPALVVDARTKCFNWVSATLGRNLTAFESYLIARSLQVSIEHRSFFDIVDTVDESPGARAIKRKK